MESVRHYTKPEASRVIKAQSYEGGYYPRSWLGHVFHAGWEVDDICRLISADCRDLGEIARDYSVDEDMRFACRSEQEDRRRYRLPASGLPFVSGDENRAESRGEIFNAGPPENDCVDSSRIGFYELLRRNSANKIDVFKHVARQGRDIAIREQSERIAQRLEALGIPAYRKAGDASFYKVGLLTGLVQSLDIQYRHILFIPAVAVAERRSLTNELTYWIENKLPKKGKYLRYAVVTCGENVRIYDDLKEEHRIWARRVSDVFRWLNQKYGSRLYFRGTEFTFNEDAETINMHMNILYDVPLLKAERWLEFLTDMRERLGCLVHDSGKLEDVNELTKYVTKPNDIEELEADHLRWFYEQTLNTRLIQRYNSFKDFKGSLKEDGLRIVRDQHDKKLKTMKKRVINDAELFTKRDEGEATISGVAKSVASFFDADVAMALCVEPSLTGQVMRDDAPPIDGVFENKIVGLMLPHCAFLNVSEPCLMVQGYSADPKTELGRDALDLMNEIARRHMRDEMVADKLKGIGSQTLSTRDTKTIRMAYSDGIRDVDGLDDYKELYARHLHDISHTPMMQVEGDGLGWRRILGIERVPEPTETLCELDEPPIEVPDSEYFEANEDAFQELADWYL